MAGSLEGPIAKLARAESQCRVLQSEVHAVWPPGKAWPVEAEVDRAGLEYRFYLRNLPRVKSDWGLLAGEILFNVRSALDHLAYQLHVHRWWGSNPAKFEEISAFPLCTRESTFIGKGKKPRGYPSSIEQLSQRDRRAIGFLQPYHPWRDAWEQVRSNLGLLNTLHNMDNHRQLHAVVAAQHAAVMMRDLYPPELGFRQLSKWGVLEPSGHVETWTFANVPRQVQPHHGAFLEVHLDAGGWSVVPMLGMLWTSAALVLLRFKDRFPPVTLPPHSALARHGWWEATGARPRLGPYLGWPR